MYRFLKYSEPKNLAFIVCICRFIRREYFDVRKPGWCWPNHCCNLHNDGHHHCSGRHSDGVLQQEKIGLNQIVTITKNSEKKESTQQELTQFDEDLEQHFEQIEEEIFNRKERLQHLEDGMIPQTNTILSAVFQEIKKQSEKTRKKSTEKKRVHFFEVKPRLPVFISGIIQAGRVKSSENRIWLRRLLARAHARYARLSGNSDATAQKLMRPCNKDSIAYLHSRSRCTN